MPCLCMNKMKRNYIDSCLDQHGLVHVVTARADTLLTRKVHLVRDGGAGVGKVHKVTALEGAGPGPCAHPHRVVVALGVQEVAAGVVGPEDV